MDVSTSVGLEDNAQKKAFGNPTWIDFNNDGLLDMISSRHRYDMNVYLNTGYGTFENIFENSNLYPTGTWDHHGFAMADYDNDGNMDMFVAEGNFSGSLLSASQLWLGDGEGRFNNVTNDSGISGYGRTAIAIDYDNDGNVDIIKLHLQDGVRLFRNIGDGTFEDKTVEAGLVNLNGRTNGASADYDSDGDMDLVLGAGPRAMLFENNGQGGFQAVYTFRDTSALHSIAWGDYDNDGDLDIAFGMGKADYTAGLVVEPNRLYFANNVRDEIGALDFSTTGGAVTFTLGAEQLDTRNVYIGASKQHPDSMPFTISEAIGEPHISPSEKGIFVWKDVDLDNWHICWSSGDRANYTGYGEISVSAGMEISDISTSYTPIDPNRTIELYQNEGNGLFTRVTEAKNMTHIGSHKGGVVWGDYDNDRDLDLYVVDSGTIAGNKENALFQNNGSGNFTDVAVLEEVTAMHAVGRHYGAAWGDYDNDGFLDLFLSQGNGFGTPLALGKEILYRNLGRDMGSANHWLKIDLEGVAANRAGIGSIVEIVSDSGTLMRHANGGGGGQMYSQGAGPLHLGLGDDKKVSRLTVRWPSGTVQRVYGVHADQIITVVEDTQPTIPGKPDAYRAGTQEGVFVWKDETDNAYHLRVSGDGDWSEFVVKLVSTESVSATPYKLESNDSWSASEYGFSLTSEVSSHEDGVDFTVPSEAKVLISVEKQGVSNPRYLRSAVDGVPLSPAGWILSSTQIASRPVFIQGEDDGLFVGHGSSQGVLEARYVSGRLKHRVGLSIISSKRIKHAKFLDLENDKTYLTDSSVTINGFVYNGWDGADVVVDRISDIGISYTADSLFQPHMVNLNLEPGSVVHPNASWLQR
ncbi:MAG: CRTAC1 family protein [Candidatus Thiodiazotropha sp. (ex Epidulcina cf. delphinae)]|nr:CRTAC1 family protein [Candidatus Thiodiazotropha sp. (ex Epidulcina cf. delphinae)]